MRTRTLVAIGVAGAATAAVLGGTAGYTLGSTEYPAEGRVVYEVIASGIGASVEYASGANALGEQLTNARLDDTSWVESPELYQGTTRARLSVTPPPGGAARCRILRYTPDRVTVLADRTGLTDQAVTCDVAE